MVLFNSPIISSIVFCFSQRHFADDQKECNRMDGKKPLKYNALPSLFDHLPSPSGRAAPMCRVQALPTAPAHRHSIDHSYTQTAESETACEFILQF
jgi:hypothetical protein